MGIAEWVIVIFILVIIVPLALEILLKPLLYYLDEKEKGKKS
jgi:hypothetical protein